MYENTPSSSLRALGLAPSASGSIRNPFTTGQKVQVQVDSLPIYIISNRPRQLEEGEVHSRCDTLCNMKENRIPQITIPINR